MPNTEHQSDGHAPKDDLGAKQENLSGNQFGDLDFLPDEVKLKIIQEIINDPDRRVASLEVTKLLRANKYIEKWILGTPDLEEKVLALRRNPGVASRHAAVCLDVASGTISVEGAIRENGPLPEVDERTASAVNEALQRAPVKHLAHLAQSFGAREGSAFDVLVLDEVAGLVADRFNPDSRRPFMRNAERVEQIATFAEAFSRNTPSLKYIRPLSILGGRLTGHGDVLLRQANIRQIAKLADAFGTRNHANYADRIVASQPRQTEAIDYLNVDHVVNNYIRYSSKKYQRQFTAIANDLVEKLASQVNATGSKLLPEATAEQLDIMKHTFSERNGPSCRSAVEKIDALVENSSSNDRSQHEERNRSRSGSAIGL
jgi:hypothetical protein